LFKVEKKIIDSLLYLIG